MQGRTVVVVEDEEVIAGSLAGLPDAVDGCRLAGARAELSRHGVFGLNLSRAHARHVLAGGRGPC